MSVSHRTLLAVLAVATHHALATTVDECSDGSSGKRLFVNIAGCDAPPCVLRKNTNATVEIRFIPGRDVETLRNRVFARVWGIPLPFVGVDGATSCDNVYPASARSRRRSAGCPLKAGKEYVYRNSFEIRSVYPSISPVVHWGLVDQASGDNVVCFEVKSSIES